MPPLYRCPPPASGIVYNQERHRINQSGAGAALTQCCEDLLLGRCGDRTIDGRPGQAVAAGSDLRPRKARRVRADGAAVAAAVGTSLVLIGLCGGWA